MSSQAHRIAVAGQLRGLVRRLVDPTPQKPVELAFNRFREFGRQRDLLFFFSMGH